MDSVKAFLQKEKLKKIRSRIAKERYEEKKEKRCLRYNKNAAYQLRIKQKQFNSPNEKEVRRFLNELNINYIWQKPFYCSKRYVCVDFYLTDFNVVLEIDGKEHEEKKSYDVLRTIYLKKVHGINRVIRIKNEDVANNKCKVMSFLNQFSNKI